MVSSAHGSSTLFFTTKQIDVVLHADKLGPAMLLGGIEGFGELPSMEI
jgi:hypothetical protein